MIDVIPGVFDPAPELDFLLLSPGLVLPGESIVLSGHFTDAGASDGHQLRIDWGDGIVEMLPMALVDGAAEFVAEHTYVLAGRYEAQVSVIDPAGGSDAETRTALVTGVARHQGVLQIVGTDGDDAVHVLRLADQYQVIGNLVTEPFIVSQADVEEMEVHAAGGDDLVTVGFFVTAPVSIHGGAGHDHLVGGYGDDRLFGDAGDDQLWSGGGDDLLEGGAGDDVLISMLGSDDLQGGDGNDALYGGEHSSQSPPLPAWEANASQWQLALEHPWNPWQNPLEPFDVSLDGSVSPLDALLIINQLNAQGSGPLPPLSPRNDDGSFLPLGDVNGDGHLSPLDALLVINYLNSGAVEGEGEGEPPGDLLSREIPTASDSRSRAESDGRIWSPRDSAWTGAEGEPVELLLPETPSIAWLLARDADCRPGASHAWTDANFQAVDDVFKERSPGLTTHQLMQGTYWLWHSPGEQQTSTTSGDTEKKQP